MVTQGGTSFHTVPPLTVAEVRAQDSESNQPHTQTAKGTAGRAIVTGLTLFVATPTQGEASDSHSIPKTRTEVIGGEKPRCRQVAACSC